MAVDRECSSNMEGVEGLRARAEEEWVAVEEDHKAEGRRLGFQRTPSRYRRVSSMGVAVERDSRHPIRTTMIERKEWRSTCYLRDRRGPMIAAEGISL